MNRKTLSVVAFVWVLSLVSVGVWAQGTVSQGIQYQPTSAVPAGTYIGEVLSGADIGFQRIAGDGAKPGAVVGKWMVKVNGRWMETQPTGSIIR